MGSHPSHRSATIGKKYSVLFGVGTLLIGLSLIGTLIPSTREWISTQVIQRGFRRFDHTDRATDQLQRLTTLYANLQQSCQISNDSNTLKQFSEHKEYTIIPALVVGTNLIATSPFYILNKGERDGIRTGMPVVAGEGILIGTVYTVDLRQSTLLPITHPSTRIAGSVLNEERTVGIVQGSANLSLQLTLVPRSEKLSIDQVVVTSGIQPRIPRGLTLGIITDIHNDPSDIFQTADIRLLADPRRFVTVGIVQDASL